MKSSKTDIVTTAFLYLCTLAIVLVTQYKSGYENLLKFATQENGFYESLTCLFLLGICIYGLVWLKKNHSLVHPFLLFLLFCFSILCFIASMEEISWGQQIFHFKSDAYFQTHNLQHETNLHNLIDGNLFSSIIYSCVYTVFVFVPLFARLFSSKSKFLSTYLVYLPPLHVSLVILFASAFQVYFYNDFGVIFDALTLAVGILLFAFVVSAKKQWSGGLALHFIAVFASILVFVNAHKLFSFYNLQYEIREMFVALGAFFYFKYFLDVLKQR